MSTFKIHHVTKYEYDRPVKESMNEVKIYPHNQDGQETLMQEINITGNPEVFTYTDYWGNKTGVFSLISSHKELLIESKMVVRTTSATGIDINFTSDWSMIKNAVEEDMLLIELSTAEMIESKENIQKIISEIKDESSIAQTVGNCSEYIYTHFNYTKGITNIETTVDEILKHEGGVCQDFAHLMLQICRTLGIPSRYVSGYICPNKSGMRGEGATHAWVEVWIPEQGWAGIDPTNNKWVTNHHVKLAVGRDFNDCTPVKGSFKGPAHQHLSVYVSVGYEDGNIFEDLTNVEMEEQPLSEDEIPENFAGQQQQQQ